MRCLSDTPLKSPSAIRPKRLSSSPTKIVVSFDILALTLIVLDGGFISKARDKSFPVMSKSLKPIFHLWQWLVVTVDPIIVNCKLLVLFVELYLVVFHARVNPNFKLVVLPRALNSFLLHFSHTISQHIVDFTSQISRRSLDLFIVNLELLLNLLQDSVIWAGFLKFLINSNQLNILSPQFGHSLL